jgi:hypothetical protein
MIILDLCGGTGSWSKPYRDAGYDVFVVDEDYILSPDICCTVQEFNRRRPALGKIQGILAAPPCRVFTRASSRNWPEYDRTGQTSRALLVVHACLDIIEHYKPEWWALENPPGRLTDQLHRPPAWSFTANQYGDDHRKFTYIWGTARKPTPLPNPPAAIPNHAIHRMGGSGRKVQSARSVTPPGFARAFFESNP